jgi:hypothetical protein
MLKPLVPWQRETLRLLSVFVNRKSTHLIIEKVPTWDVGYNKLIVRKVPI